jgi:ribonuclease J
MAKDNELVFLPLGGVGEIGMNLALYGYGTSEQREWIMVDCGVTFPGPELPGVDLVLPDIRFLEEERHNLKAIVITHAHEDHYGALNELWPLLNVPVYVTPFTAGMLEAKRAYERSRREIPVNIFNAGDVFSIGPFEIEAVAVNHSIPEPLSLAIKTPLGKIIHTGDWKIDHEPSLGPMTDENRFRQLGDEGILAIMCDSTNAMRDDISPTEQTISKNLCKVIENAPGRVAVTSFSSNVGRIRSIAEAARDAGREVLLLGSSIKRVVSVATGLGMMDGLPNFLEEDEFGFIPRDKVVIIMTGSQGESRAALAKLSRDEMRHVALAKDDTVVFSARAIPGNEKGIINIKNALIDSGIIIVEDSDELPIHVSGHPCRNELKQMYEWVRPDILVPVHGEAAHLVAHTKLALESGIPTVPRVRNGDMIRLAPGEPTIIDEVPSGRIYKDGAVLGDLDDLGINDRRKLSFAGHVSALVLLDQRYEIKNDPLVSTMGLPTFDDAGDEIDDIIYDAIIGAVESIPRTRRKDLSTVQEAVRRAIRSSVREVWNKKPVATVFVEKV